VARGEFEFGTVTHFTSLDAVRRFAAADYETAALHPEAHASLSRYDPKSVQYEIRITPELELANKNALQFRPLTARNWNDLETLFGPRGACAGCWCMYYRLSPPTWKKQKGEKNRRAFRLIVASGAPTGVLAYAGREPVGWCAVAPRQELVRLQKSRILKPVDEQPVWSVTCFYVAKKYRRSGITVSLLKAGVEYAIKRGAQIVEGYPHDAPVSEMPDVFAWNGFVSAFRKAGFQEIARRSATRPVMRHIASD
jgi:GNAT superfamily N-acetyltransferase